MSSRWRRFEVLLPLQFNDGRDVPGEWIAEAMLEIVDHFGAASYETQKVEGHWRHSGILYRDDLVRIVVDVPDSPRNRQWMKQFKDRWESASGAARTVDGELSHRGRISKREHETREAMQCSEPNKALQPTASSVRSCVAPASSSA